MCKMLFGQRCQTENEVAQLKRDLFGADQGMVEARETAWKYEKHYHETLVELERAGAGNPTASGRADQVLLNSATQQLNQLRAGHAPSTAEWQLAAQQSQTNEQLDVLHAECNTLRAAATKTVAECDPSCRAHLKLWMDSLTGTTTSVTETALMERCIKAKAMAEELQKENTLLKERNVAQSQMLDEQELAAIAKTGATTTSAAMGPLSFPTLSEVEMAQASSQLGEGMSGISTPRASPLPPVGRGTTAYLAGPIMGSAGSTPFPSLRVGAGGSHVLLPGPYLGTSSVTAGQLQGIGGTMETEGAAQTPVVSTVTTGTPSTMTDQGPAQAGAQPSFH